MPDQIDLSRMQSVPIVGPRGHLRLHRFWKEASNDMWDDIWEHTQANEYWRHSLTGALPKDYEHMFMPYLHKGEKILEAGCGVGQVVLALRARGFDCHGLDFAETTIKKLNENFPDVPFDLGDIRTLPYSNNSFDAYISLGVIEHFLEGQEKILMEAARVVKPGGTIFLSVPALNSWRKIRCRNGSYHHSSTEPFFEACFSREELEELLNEAGFTPIDYSYQNTVMTFAQETLIRPFYRRIEDTRYIRSAIDRSLRFLLPREWFGHMIMLVARRNNI